MDILVNDNEDTFVVSDDLIPNTIKDTTEVVNVVDSDDGVIVSELSDSININELGNEVVNIVDTDDTLDIEFQEVHQSIINNITNDNSVFSGIAAENLGGHRIVVAFGSQISYADNTISSHSAIVTGITTQAVLSGSTVDVTISGEVAEGSWNWTLNTPIFLTANGLMTQIVPNTGFILQVGYPTSNTSMVVDIKTAIVLST